MDFEPHPYQERMIQHVLDHPYCALFAEMGLGKTVTTLTALQTLFDQIEVRKALVVAPKRVAMNVWPAEIAKWSHVNRLTYTVLNGGPEDRRKKMRSRTDIHIINYDLFPWLVKQHTESSWPYDVLVLDESSKLKNRSTHRFRAARHARRKADRVIELAGTPAPNSLMDLWSQIFLLDLGERLGKTITGYRNRWFTEIPYAHKWVLRPRAAEDIHRRIDDICISLKTEDYLTLPPRIDNIIAVPFPRKTKTRYYELANDFVLDMGDQETITAANAAVLTSKLLQYCNGAMYTDEGGGDWAYVHNAKLEALESVVNEAEGPILLAYPFRFDIDRIKDAFPQAVALDHDPETIERWNRQEIPLLLAHPQSAGHGLNLQDGGHTIVWFGPTWSLENYLQFNARLIRQGQTKSVVVHHIIMEGSIEERVMSVLEGKSTVQDALMGALKLAGAQPPQHEMDYGQHERPIAALR